jgi:hypothetical protein
VAYSITLVILETILKKALSYSRMEQNGRQKEAISALKNKLLVIQGIDEIRDDLFSSMILDWINNATPNEPGFETPLQVKELLEQDYPNMEIDNQIARELYDAWIAFVNAYYAVNGGKRRHKKTRKQKKRAKKTRKH